MRRVLCKECGSRYPKEGKVTLFEQSTDGPAEYGRIVKGKALQPDVKQRVVYLNDVPYPLDTTGFDCDMCNKKIKPGDDATCLTVWVSYREEPAEWESQYLKKGE